MLNKKYDTKFVYLGYLYMNIKGASMYDGMQLHHRQGDTQSKFLLTLGEDIYPEMRDWFTEKNGGVIHKGASSRKLKMQTKVGIVKKSLLEHDKKAYDYSQGVAKASDVTTQKDFICKLWIL